MSSDPSAPAATGAPSAPAAHVLLVEDNPTNQLVATLLLQKMNVTCTVANDGQEALDLIGSRAFDAVLMDCQMPGVDGYTATRRIREGRMPGVDPKIPIIALTAYAMVSDRERCLAAGMNEHVPKPIRSDELRAALRRQGVLRPATAEKAAPPSDRLIDPQVLEDYRDLPGQRHATVVLDLAHDFLECTPTRFESLQLLLRRRSADEAAHLAHSLAGSCANLGARSVRSALISVEKAARLGDWTLAADRLAFCETLIHRLQAELRNLVEAQDAA